MAKGLDIGTAFFVSAVKNGDEIVTTSMRDAFLNLENSDMVENMMTRSGVKYLKKDNEIYVVGEEAVVLSSAFGKEVRRPMSSGVINPKDVEAIAMLKIILDKLVGKASKEKELICYSIPGNPVDADFKVDYHEGEFKRLLTELGYKAESLNEGQAVVYSELEDELFSGCGISMGAGTINFSFCYKSIPIFAYSIAKAGDYIDQDASKATDVPVSRITLLKEQQLVLDVPSEDRVLRSLQIAYENLITYVIKHIRQQVAKSNKLPPLKEKINFVISGGTSMPKGFIDMFEKVLKTISFPFEVGVRASKNPLTAVARGCLIAALAKEK